jgi:hypothetical protein
MTKKYKVIEILEHATILNSDGTKTNHNIIYISRDGIHIGNIVFKPKTDLLNLKISCIKNSQHTCFNAYEEFVKTHFIPKQHIQRIDSKYKRCILTQI